MPLPLNMGTVTNTGATILVLTTETVLATLGGLTTSFAGQTFRFFGVAIFNTTGVGTTGITMRIRRGTGITGALAGVAIVITAAAGAAPVITHAAEDSPGEVTGQQYVLTAQQQGSTANGTVSFAELLAVVFG